MRLDMGWNWYNRWYFGLAREAAGQVLLDSSRAEAEELLTRIAEAE